MLYFNFFRASKIKSHAILTCNDVKFTTKHRVKIYGVHEKKITWIKDIKCILFMATDMNHELVPGY